MKEQQKYYFVNDRDLIGPFTAEELLNHSLYFTTLIVIEGSNNRIPLKECKELMAIHKANRKKYPPILSGENFAKSNSSQSSDSSFSGLKIALIVFGLLLLILKIIIRLQ